MSLSAFASLMLLATQPPSTDCETEIDSPCEFVSPALPNHAEGLMPVEIIVRFDVLADGSTANVSARSADPEREGLGRFIQSSVNAVEQWMFAPGHARSGVEHSLVFRWED